MTTQSPQVSARTTNDCDQDALLLRIVDEIAAARGVEPLDVPPLHESVDVDALTGLVESSSPTHPTGMTVSFRIEDLVVFVFGDGSIDVEQRVDTTADAEALAVE